MTTETQPERPKKKRRRRKSNQRPSQQHQPIDQPKVYGINVDALLLPNGNSLEGSCTEIDLREAGADIGWLLADEIIVDMGVTAS